MPPTGSRNYRFGRRIVSVRAIDSADQFAGWKVVLTLTLLLA